MTAIVFLSMMAMICSLKSVDSRPQIPQNNELPIETGTGFRIIRERFNDEEFEKQLFGNLAGEEGIRHKRSVKDNDNGPKVAMDYSNPSGERRRYPFLGNTLDTLFATLAAALPPSFKPIKQFPKIFNPFE